MSAPVLENRSGLRRTRSATAHTLQTLADLANFGGLPNPNWNVDDVYGPTGTFIGADDKVLAAVNAWAEDFGVKADVVQPEAATRDGWTVIDPGWIVAHVRMDGVRITIGGRLTELPEVAW